MEHINILAKRSIGLWCLLAFQAGFLNSLGFLSCHSFVSHVTGFGSQIGISLGTNEHHQALELFLAPFTFILGAAYASLFTEMRVIQKKRGRYFEVSIFIAVLISALGLAGILGLFGEFGEPLIQDRDFILLHALCFICGMQNACFSIFTKSSIKTTHLTGLVTDIGVSIPKMFLSESSLPEEVFQERRKMLMRLMIFFSFMIGAMMSAYLLNKHGFYSFVVPAMTAWTVVIYLRVGFNKEI